MQTHKENLTKIKHQTLATSSISLYYGLRMTLGTPKKPYERVTKMIQNTVQKTIGDNREQELTQEVLRLQEQVDTLVAQREMLQKALYQKSNTTESQKD